MSAKSFFVTRRHSFRSAHFDEVAAEAEAQQPWFRQSVPVPPGQFIIPGPDAISAHDPMPPRDQLKGEPVGLQDYFGRVNDVEAHVFVLTLWEVPNCRELYLNLVRRRTNGVSYRGTLGIGTLVSLWTWKEPKPKDEWRERLHLEPYGHRRRSRTARG